MPPCEEGNTLTPHLDVTGQKTGSTICIMRNGPVQGLSSRPKDQLQAFLLEDLLEELNDDLMVKNHRAQFPDALLHDIASRLAKIPKKSDREHAKASLVAHRLELTLVPQKNNSISDEERGEIPEAVVNFMKDYRMGACRVLLGFGKSGMVLESLRYNDRCHKVRLPHVLQPAGTNTPVEEKNIQEKIAKLSSNSGTKVPQIKAYMTECGGIIVMQSVAGVTVRDVLEKDVPLPASYRHEIFFDALEQFVSEMHNAGYYHRDLHPGNIMIDSESGMPYIIDFGMSIHTHFPDDEVFQQKVAVNGQFKDIVLKSDESWIQITKNRLGSYLSNKKDL